MPCWISITDRRRTLFAASCAVAMGAVLLRFASFVSDFSVLDSVHSRDADRECFCLAWEKFFNAL